MPAVKIVSLLDFIQPTFPMHVLTLDGGKRPRGSMSGSCNRPITTPHPNISASGQEFTNRLIVFIHAAKLLTLLQFSLAVPFTAVVAESASTSGHCHIALALPRTNRAHCLAFFPRAHISRQRRPAAPMAIAVQHFDPFVPIIRVRIRTMI